MLNRWHRVWRTLRVRPRLWVSGLLGGLAYAALSLLWPQEQGARALIAWNVFALLYLTLSAHMAIQGGVEQMRSRALVQDDGSHYVLVLAVVAAVAVLLAIGSQLSTVKELHGLDKTRHVSLAAITLVSSWLITQTLFALHYAHDFYASRARGQPDGLLFPGTTEPEYGDFMYFACIIGTSAQTADVSFTSTAMRRVGLVHCVLAFFFNTTVLALTINIAAGLF